MKFSGIVQEIDHSCEVYVVKRMNFGTILDSQRLVETPGIVQPTHRPIGISKPNPHTRLERTVMDQTFFKLMRKTATVGSTSHACIFARKDVPICVLFFSALMIPPLKVLLVFPYAPNNISTSQAKPRPPCVSLA